MRRFARAFAAFSLLGAALGCQPDFGVLEFDPISTPPTSIQLRSFLIEIPAGVAVVVEAKPISRNDVVYGSDTRVDLISQDRDVLVVQRRSDRRQFALVGVAPGETCVEVFIDGRSEDCIDAVVTPQQ